jgi:hypothetical protein
MHALVLIILMNVIEDGKGGQSLRLRGLFYHRIAKLGYMDLGNRQRQGRHVLVVIVLRARVTTSDTLLPTHCSYLSPRQQVNS